MQIAGTGYHEKINAALATGGPERLIETIQQNFGIPINHFVQVELPGLPVARRRGRRHPDLLPVAGPRPPHRLRRRDAGLHHARRRAGARLSPGRATSRPSRTAAGPTDPTSDLGRIARQQQFIKLALKRAIAKGARNPFVDSQLIGTAEHDVTLDDQLTTGDLLSLAAQFRNFDPNSLQVYTPPATGSVIGGADVLLLDAAARPAHLRPVP